jgi:citrate lyase acyl carrier protein
MAKSTAGQQGSKVRSDCYIEITSKRIGGIKLEFKSKVDVMYGESIRTTILDMCKFFELKHVNILVEDYGALPTTLMARFEMAVKRLNPKMEKEYLPDFNKKNKYQNFILMLVYTNLMV